jgi:hypothetical protein
MRKAFDANVPKLKPRLKSAVVVVSKSSQETGDESIQLYDVLPHPRAAMPAPVKEPKPDCEPSPEPASAENHSYTPVADTTADLKIGTMEREIPVEQEAAANGEPSTATPASPAPPIAPARDSENRRERLEKVKRKVVDAVRSGIRIEPVPEDPAQAAESVLGLVSDLETRLSRTRDLEKALRADLTQATTELARVVTEGRAAAERLGQAEAQLSEKGKVLEEMLIEMGALEEERDQAVRRVQTLTSLDEQRKKQIDDLGRRSAEMEKALSESKVECERLSNEFDERMAENAQLRSVLSQVTQERDSLARDAGRLTKERDELAQAKKALEKVHQALSQARARLGN